MEIICFLKFPRFIPIDTIAIVAMQLQSDGNVMTQITMATIIFCHSFILSFSMMDNSTSPHASDHTTPV